MNLKVEKNKIWYFNGKRWLIRETCKSNKEAVKLLKNLNGRSNPKENQKL